MGTKMYQDVPRFLDLLRLLHHLTSMKSANHNERIATLHIGTNWDPQTGPQQLPGNCCANFLAKARAKRGSEGPPKDTETMTRWYSMTIQAVLDFETTPKLVAYHPNISQQTRGTMHGMISNSYIFFVFFIQTCEDDQLTHLVQSFEATSLLWLAPVVGRDVDSSSSS